MADAKTLEKAPLRTPTDLGANATKDIAAALNGVLADSYALYFKTKNFHWHVSGPHFRDYHLMFDEQAAQILTTTDAIAERVRKTGNTTLRSIGDISRHQSLKDNDADFVAPADMLKELRELLAILPTKPPEADEADDFLRPLLPRASLAMIQPAAKATPNEASGRSRIRSAALSIRSLPLSISASICSLAAAPISSTAWR